MRVPSASNSSLTSSTRARLAAGRRGGLDGQRPGVSAAAASSRGQTARHRGQRSRRIPISAVEQYQAAAKGRRSIPTASADTDHRPHRALITDRDRKQCGRAPTADSVLAEVKRLTLWASRRLSFRGTAMAVRRCVVPLAACCLCRPSRRPGAWLARRRHGVVLPDCLVDLRDPVTDLQCLRRCPGSQASAGPEHADGCGRQEDGANDRHSRAVPGCRLGDGDGGADQERYRAVPEHQARSAQSAYFQRR